MSNAAISLMDGVLLKRVNLSLMEIELALTMG
jgi:hypothetical protein